LRERIDAQGAELSSRIDALSDRMDARMDALSERIDALQRSMILVGGGLIAGMLATLITVLIALVSTQS
jgi:hypothetical protein